MNHCIALRNTSALLTTILLAACGADSDPKYSVGGSVSGLAGSGLELTLGTQRLTLSANGTFAFPKGLPGGATYAVAVRLHPDGQGCVITNPMGTVSTTDITDIAITCTAAAPLALVSAAPSDQLMNVSRVVHPALLFSAQLNPATLTADNLHLQGATTYVPLAASATGADLTVIPARRLLPLTDYTLTVGTGLRGAQGEQPTTDMALHFRTRDGTWQPRETHGNPERVFVDTVKLATNANGDAMLMWKSLVDASRKLYFSRYTQAAGWSEAEVVESKASGYRDYIAGVGMDDDGNTIAVWTRNSDASGCGDDDGCSQERIVVRRHTVERGWGNATILDTEVHSDSSSMSPRLAMNARGDAAVVWGRRESSRRSDVRMARYTPGSGWSSNQTVAGAEEYSFWQQAAMDSDGNVMVAWNRFDGTRVNAWANRHEAGNGWGTATPLESDDGNAIVQRLIMNERGDALVVWLAESTAPAPFSRSAWSSHYTPDSGWQEPEAIGVPDSGVLQNFDIAIDTNGDALAVWEHAEVIRPELRVIRSILAVRYVAGTGWQIPEPLLTADTSGRVPRARMVQDASGNAIAVWSMFQGSRMDVMSSRYVPEAGWSEPVLLENDDAGDADLDDLVMNGSGDAIAAWVQWDGMANRVHTARFE